MMRVIQGIGTLCKVYTVRRCGTIKRWPVRERIQLPHPILRTGHHVHHTTGFDREEIIDLCIRINSLQPGTGSPNWPPCLGLFKWVWLFWGDAICSVLVRLVVLCPVLPCRCVRKG